MAKFRKPPTPRRTKRVEKTLRRAAGPVALILIGAVAGAAITTDRLDGAVSGVGDLFSSDPPKPSYAERVVDRLFRDTRAAHIWAEKPTMYPQSKRYMLEHFAETNPLRPHRSMLPHLPVVSPDQLAAEMPFYVGGRITVVGKVRYSNIGSMAPSVSRLWSPTRRKRITVPNAIYIAQIGTTFNDRKGALVYVLFTEAAVRRLRNNQWIAAMGVPIAGGALHLLHGGDIAAGAYVAAASVVPVRGPHAVEKVAEARARRHRAAVRKAEGKPGL